MTITNDMRIGSLNYVELLSNNFCVYDLPEAFVGFEDIDPESLQYDEIHLTLDEWERLLRYDPI